MIGADDKGVSSPLFTFTRDVMVLAKAAKADDRAKGEVALTSLWDTTRTLLLEMPDDKEVRKKIRSAAAKGLEDEKATLCIPGNSYLSPAVFNGTPGYWVEAWVFIPGSEVIGDEAADK